MRTALLVLSLAAALPVAAACTTKKPVPVESGADFKPQWEPATSYAYELSMVSDTALSPDNALHLKLGGTLELTTLRGNGAKLEFIARVIGARLTSTAGTGSEALDNIAKELDQPYAFVLDGGKLTGFRLPSAASAMATGFRRSIAAALQFVAASGRTRPWTSTEYDATGEYLAQYSRGVVAGSFAKKKLRYTRLTAAQSAPGLFRSASFTPEVVRSDTQLAFGNGQLQAFRQTEELRTPLGNSAAMTSRTQTSLNLRSTRAAQPRELQPPAGDAVIIGAHEPSRVSGLEPVLDQARSANMTVDEAIAALERVERPDTFAAAAATSGKDGSDDVSRLRESSGPFIALKTLVRSDDGAVATVVKKIESTGRAHGVLLDALGAAGTDPAQAALVRFATNAKARDELRARAAMSLIRTERAAPATIDALVMLADDPKLSTYGLYGLGTAARRLRDQAAVALADRAATFLVRRLDEAKSDSERIHVLRGIANSGYNGALPSVRPLLTHRSGTIRAAAVESLRLMTDPSVEPLILEHLDRSSDSSLRRAALNAIKVREPSSALIVGVTRFVRTSSDPYARMRAVELLSRWLPKHPELKPVLEEVAAREERSRIREAAQVALTP
jgi:hypothetical protein